MKYKELIWMIIRLILEEDQHPRKAVRKIAERYDLLPSELWSLLPEHYKD